MLSCEQLSHPPSEGVTIGTGALRPASVHSMMCRVARNINNVLIRRPANGLELPWYAVLSSLSILEPDNRLNGTTCDFIRSSPHLCDTDIDIIDRACESKEIDGYEEHRQFCQIARHYDGVGSQQRRKSLEYSMVRFSIGQVFKHRLLQYKMSSSSFF